MIKPELVTQLLQSLREHVSLLRPFQAQTLDELTRDMVRWHGILHLLQLSVQHVIDISAHLLAGLNAAVPDDYREIILKLGMMGILPYDFAQRIAPMAGFRNVVAHEYLTVDPLIVSKILHQQLSDFDEFIARIYEYLQREGHL